MAEKPGDDSIERFKHKVLTEFALLILTMELPSDLEEVYFALQMAEKIGLPKQVEPQMIYIVSHSQIQMQELLLVNKELFYEQQMVD